MSLTWSCCRGRMRCLVVMLAVICPVSARAADHSYRLANGMEVILKENHSSSMVASMIFVKSGSKYEGRFENGLTHFLEHLLFDGTTHLSREELDGSINGLGGYINAFTRKDLTAYLVLLPRQYINYGLTVQADMLFNSVFPEDELAKERKVVVEEIKRDADAPGSAAEAFFTAKAYGGTPYGRPVLGYQSFVENIPRDAIIHYWKANYTPARMMLLVIGDFSADSMTAKIDSIFGGISNPKPAVDTPGQPPIVASRTVTEVPEFEAGLTGQARFDTVAAVTSTYVNISVEAPAVGDADYFAFDILSQYLAMAAVSPLLKALTEGSDPLASEAAVQLVPYEEFTRLEISAITERPERADRIYSTVVDILSGLSAHAASPEAIEGIKITNKCEQIYNAEKLHYYGFIISPLIMAGGWDFIQSYSGSLDAVQWSDCRAAAERWLDKPEFVATVVRPAAEGGSPAFEASAITAEEVTGHFDSTVFVPYNLSQGIALNFPVTDSISFELTDEARYHQETLTNGLTIIVKSSPYSGVFAMNVLGRNRSANETATSAGITDFVNRCIEKGTVTRDARQLSSDLARIGANVTLYDNPWIPYDDRYTTPSFSFMKFETIDEFAEKGFYLFSEMLLDPAFDSVEVENVRQSMLATLGRDATSPPKVSRRLFYETLFEGKAFARPEMGSPESISAITRADLKEHHRRYYSPENMIIAIATSRSIPEVMEWVDHRLGRLGQVGYETAVAEEPDRVAVTRTAHKDLEKEQINIYLGGKLPGATDGEYASIAVAARILSERLYLNLREKQGLAYTIGAGIDFDREFGWYHCSMGTGAANYQTALDGILLQIDKLKLDGPSQEEVERARNQTWGRLMSAKLSLINQAFYLCQDVFLGRGLGFDQRLLSGLEAVTVESVRRVCSLYFRTDAYVLATAGK
ncbi:MAG: insulinase family protein, partial [candidate division Zixibacteria bacterium]|nr:insulinase family protein [candidate division Zixibacteria bacterium]